MTHIHVRSCSNRSLARTHRLLVFTQSHLFDIIKGLRCYAFEALKMTEEATQWPDVVQFYHNYASRQAATRRVYVLVQPICPAAIISLPLQLTAHRTYTCRNRMDIGLNLLEDMADMRFYHTIRDSLMGQMQEEFGDGISTATFTGKCLCLCLRTGCATDELETKCATLSDTVSQPHAPWPSGPSLGRRQRGPARCSPGSWGVCLLNPSPLSLLHSVAVANMPYITTSCRPLQLCPGAAQRARQQATGGVCHCKSPQQD